MEVIHGIRISVCRILILLMSWPLTLKINGTPLTFYFTVGIYYFFTYSLCSSSVLSFQVKNTTIIHLLSLFSRPSPSGLLTSLIYILRTSAGQHSPIFCDCLVTTTEAIVEKGHRLIVNMLPFACNLQKEIQRDKHLVQLEKKNLDLVFSTNKHRIGKTGRQVFAVVAISFYCVCQL